MDTPIEVVKDNVGMVANAANIIIDPVNPLENEDYAKYVTMLQMIKTHLENTGSIGIIHMLKNGDEPDHRSHTLAMADMVWDVEQELQGDELDTRLLVTKCRSGILPEKVAKVDLRDSVAIDTSRNIA
jgi:KaiC/GvpD/RAD55 family RecA-like ATPase